MERLERIGYAALVGLAFGVGALFGARYCQATGQELGASDPEAELVRRDECPERAVTRTVDRIVYECPPEPEPPSKVAKKGNSAGARASDPERELPAPDPVTTSLARRRLLAWAREQSEELQSCRDHGKEIFRIAVVLHLKTEDRTIKRVDLNAEKGEVPRGVQRCLRERILKWQLPSNVELFEQRIVFGLHL